MIINPIQLSKVSKIPVEQCFRNIFQNITAQVLAFHVFLKYNFHNISRLKFHRFSYYFS